MLTRSLAWMHYTRVALLLFGFGLLTGFVAVVEELSWLGWVAAPSMALALLCLPVAVAGDGVVRPIMAAFRSLLSRGKKRPRTKSRASVRRKPQAKARSRAPRRAARRVSQS